jgi:ferredoxin--NADP+ reductase
VSRLLEDVEAGRVTHDPEVTPEAVESLLAERGANAIIYSGWTSIDDFERAAGEKLGRPRVKLRTWDELLEAAGSPGRGTPVSPVRGG